MGVPCIVVIDVYELLFFFAFHCAYKRYNYKESKVCVLKSHIARKPVYIYIDTLCSNTVKELDMLLKKLKVSSVSCSILQKLLIYFWTYQPDQAINQGATITKELN